MKINFENKTYAIFNKNIFNWSDEDPRNLNCRKVTDNLFQDKKEKYKIIFHNKTSKSKNLPELKFTNFISSELAKEYIKLTHLYSKLEDIEKNFEKYFGIEEQKESNENKTKRLKNIISKVTDKNIEDITKFYKIKYQGKDNNKYPFRFYTKIRKKGELLYNLHIYLIDIYHLAWTSEYKGKDSPDHLYGYHKKNNFCISKIAIK